MIPAGVALDPEDSHFAIPFFKGRILRTFIEGNFNYLSVWAPKTESHIYDFALEEVAASLPEADYTSTPDVTPEVLHQSNQCTVRRLRFPTGWLYIVGVQLGFPWPSFYLIPCLAHTRGAPLVAVDRVGAGIDVKFWVADNNPYGPEN
ncbi:hypothetical protein GCM10022252_20010 [Streptosporangium oxazolinicum]|uniref:Uncharacterized protein n=2 Tax=Streptosporangium oxazolinicum TaxID=909287 RepID=A0ABP8APC6_9ACTN